MREIKDVAQDALGHAQICEPLQAVRRLAQEFNAVKAQLAEANARREAANAALGRAESDHLKACAELDEANAREATLRRLAERLWGKVNERRCDLIKREVAGHASERDLAELAELQAMADDYMHATAPLPIEKLEAYMRAHGIEIPDARQGEWQFCETDEKCYLRSGHGGKCEKTKERRTSYTRQAQEGEEE
jgi:DNA repair exonuclease SbcCD ATPase subunit